MPASDYVRALRARVGRDLLLLPGASALIFDDAGRVLLQRRGDSGRWSVIGGGVDPGETPAEAAVREAREETGLDVEPARLVGVYATPEITYPNGDRCAYVVTAFRCRVVGGTLRPDGDESLELAWFDPAALPPMRLDLRQRVLDAVPERGEAAWQRDGL